MADQQCPICFAQLEARDVAPCYVCGADPEELKHLREHQFAQYELLPGQMAVLCNTCWGDLGSIEPDFFGFRTLPKSFRVPHLQRDVTEPIIEKDKFCPSCRYRLAFLRLVAAVREINRVNGAA